MIHDNAMVPSEVIQCMKNKRSGRNDLMALKLDMAKAFDRL